MHTLRNLYQSQASLLAEQHDIRQIFLPDQGEASFDVLFPFFRGQAVLGPGAPVPDQQGLPPVPFLPAPGPEDFFRQVVSPFFPPPGIRGDAGGTQGHFRRQVPGEFPLLADPPGPFFPQPGQQVLPPLKFGLLEGFLDGPGVIQQEEHPVHMGTVQTPGMERTGMPHPFPAPAAQDPRFPDLLPAAGTAVGIEQGLEQGKDG